ncbi:MAG: extracellular solute-binding protein [Patescibacteria group bacterium]
MNNFQTILVAVFMAFFVFAVLIFSGLINIGGSSDTSNGLVGKVVIWGTFSNPEIHEVFDKISETNQELVISYVTKKEATYQKELVEAFANGTGPDLFIISPDMIQNNRNFIYAIPYASYPEKSFRSSFIDGADIYLTTEGTLGFPLVVDPMVLYYNKDLLANEGIATPPAYWNELFELNGRLTKRTDDGTITQSMIGLGRFENVANAKDILATLLLQSGNQIVSRSDTRYQSVLSATSASGAQSVAEQILEFYVEFSNPSLSSYAWNRSLPNSLDMFTGGREAFYLGHASELFKIQSINPNLSFDVTDILQTKGLATKRTYADIYALAINKKSPNMGIAFGVATLLGSDEAAKNFATTVSLPPALRSLLSSRPADPYLFTFFNASLISRAWPDPDTIASDAIFDSMIQNIISNRLSMSAAVAKASSELDLINKR